MPWESVTNINGIIRGKGYCSGRWAGPCQCWKKEAKCGSLGPFEMDRLAGWLADCAAAVVLVQECIDHMV